MSCYFSRASSVSMIAVAVVVLSGARTSTRGQLDPRNEAFDVLDSLGTTAARLTPGTLTNREYADIDASLRWLTTSLRKPVSRVNGAMIQSLKADLSALKRLPTTDPSTQRRLADSISSDLSLKAGYCRRQSDGMNATATLTIRTWTAKTEVKQWQVAYLNAPLAILNETKAELFPAFSSPTALALPPGRYVVWAQDPTRPSIRGPAKDVSLGRTSGSGPAPPPEQITADIVVPAR